MKRRADSGSRRSCSAVDPTRSANTIVTVLRVSAIGVGPMRWTPLAFDSLRAPLVGAPHSSQNLAVGRSSAPQLEHPRLSGAAHSSQNFAPGRF